MNEKELELYLLDNPNYSSGWIQNAVPLMCKYGLGEGVINQFDTEQLQLILSVFASAEQNENIWIGGF